MTPFPTLSIFGVAIVAGALSAGAVHAWHLFRRRRTPAAQPSRAASMHLSQPTRYGPDPAVSVAEDLRRLCQEDLLLRDPAHEHIRARVSDAVDALEAHQGRRLQLGDVDLGRILAEVARGRDVALPSDAPIPRVWADHVRLARSMTWMLEEALRGGHGACVEVEQLPGERLATRVWPRRDLQRALMEDRSSVLPYLRGANRFTTERSWAAAQGGTLSVRALGGGDPVFVLELSLAAAPSSAALK